MDSVTLLGKIVLEWNLLRQMYKARTGRVGLAFVVDAMSAPAELRDLADHLFRAAGHPPMEQEVNLRG